LVGGLLYVYTAGTTTPATTYTDPSGTVNNTNPIVLDAGGRTPYEIWVNGGVLYKFVLKTSTGVTIGTYDSIPAIDDPTAFNNIITVTGTNTLLGTSTPPNTAYARGMTLSFVVVNTNTGAVTIDVDGLGAKEITFSGSTPLIAGQMTADALVTIEYDGTRFQLMNSSGALAITASSINGGQIAGFRNRIINGNCQVAQRGTAAVVNNAWTYGGCDRIAVGASGFTSLTGTIGQISPAFGNGTAAQGLTSVTTVGSGSVLFQTRIESKDALALNGQTVTFNAYVYHDTGLSVSVSLSLLKANSVDNFGAQTQLGTTSTSVPSGVWTRIIFSMTIGATDASNGIAAQVSFPTGAVSNKQFAVSLLQLEIGSTATPFEQRLIGTELALCQRYFVSGLRISAAGYTSSGVTESQSGYFPVEMRATPTLGTPTYGSTGAISALSQGAFNAKVFTLNSIGTSTAGYIVSLDTTASAEL
jgi:hypothetical protein